MDKRQRKRMVCGITATKGEGLVWTWQVNTRTYRWCLLRHIEEFMPDGSIVRRATVSSIDAAIAFTVGYSQGQYSVIGDSMYSRLLTTQENSKN